MHSKFQQDEAFKFFGDGEQTRDFVYVKDLVQAVSIVINSDYANGGIYNLGTSKPLSLLEMFDEFKKLYSKTIDYSFTEARSGDIKHSYAEIDDLKALGYTPKYSVEEGLKEYINYTDNN